MDDNLPTKFENYISIGYEDMKGNAKCRIKEASTQKSAKTHAS